jgi:hypothetical protein
MYWLASDSTWTSISCSRRLAGRVIFLVMTAAVGNAKAMNLVDVPSRFQQRCIVSDTASTDARLPSTTASLGSGSIA